MQFLELSTAEKAIRILMAVLCKMIYPIISFLYDLFNNVSQINILSLEDVKPIYNRITIILTIVMVFYITFQFVKYIVQPQEMTDKEKGAGKIVYKMIMVIVLIAFVPRIFEIGYKVQNAIISKNVISKVILGPQAINDESNLGSSFSATVFNMFYYVEEENKGKECHDGIDCASLVSINIDALKSDNSLSALTIGLNDTEKKQEIPLINFDGILAVIVGGFILYILILYCIDVGVRWVQLLYLQIIAPIPILGYLSPKKDGIFQKWTKQCLTTYLDLFLRVAIINIVLLLCDTLLKSKITGELIPEGATGLMATLIYIVLIMAVMLFAHKAPKMLAELFPKSGAASGNFGLNYKERGLNNASRVFGAAAGAATGAAVGLAAGAAQGFRRKNSLDKHGNKKGMGAGIWGATKGAVSGTLGGATRGLVNGAKKGNVLKNSIAGAKNQVKASQRFGNREENGYTFTDQMGDRLKSATGMRSRIETQEAKKAPISRHDTALKKVADTRSKIEDRAISKLKENGGKGGIKAQIYDKEQQRLKDLQENNEVRSREFRVGRFKDDKQAQDEYNKALENAKASVSKSNFIIQTPEKLDEAGYNAALKAAEASVEPSKFKDPKTNQFDQDGYDAAVTLAKAAVNKSNFITPGVQQFDQAGYNAAVAKAASTVDASNYTVAYKSEAEAQNAYNQAVKAKTDAIDRNMFATDAEYDAALKEAAATVNKDIYIKGYETQAEAEDALAKEINSQKKIVSDAKDAAVEEYVANSGDGAIDSMLDILATEIREYNNTASADVKINEIDKSAITSDFKAFSDYVKSGEIKQAQDRNTNKLIEINAEIDKIKRQQEGSGINDGKK